MRTKLLLATLFTWLGSGSSFGQIGVALDQRANAPESAVAEDVRLSFGMPSIIRVSEISANQSFKLQVFRKVSNSGLNHKQKVAQYVQRLGGGFRPPMVSWNRYPEAGIDAVIAEKLDSEFDRRGTLNGHIEAVVTANFPKAAWTHKQVLDAVSEAESSFKNCAPDNCVERLHMINQLRTQLVQAEQARKLIHMLLDDSGMIWQLEDFWYNHFNIHARKSVRDVSDFRSRLRGAMFGKFENMLLLTAKHPAMLTYLDNRLNTKNNINENFGREVMELHTLGKGPQRVADEANGTYSQADVENSARILTGWGIGPETEGARGFLFSAEKHFDAPATIMGKTFAQHDYEQGRQFLKYLANHPATARNICRKLVRRFVHENPDNPEVQPLINLLIKRFQSSGGDLLLVYQEMIASDAFWSASALRTQWKKPSLAVVSALRQMGIGIDDISTESVLRWISVIRDFGEDLLMQTPPTGYSDFNKDWVNANNAILWNKFLAAETEVYVASPKYSSFESCLRRNMVECQKIGLGANPTVITAAVSGLSDVFSLDAGFAFHPRLTEDIPWLTQDAQSDMRAGVHYPLRTVLEYYLSTPDFLRY